MRFDYTAIGDTVNHIKARRGGRISITALI